MAKGLLMPGSLAMVDVEREIATRGREICERVRAESPGMFNRAFWQGILLEWAMRDEEFKTDLFRFVDVLPSLSGHEQINDHVRQYLLREHRDLPATVRAALSLATNRLTAGLGASAIRRNVLDMANQFIAGSTPKEALSSLRSLRKEGIAASVDLLGEATLSNAEADVFQARYLDLIDTLADDARHWPDDPLLDNDAAGPIPKASVSLKISALAPYLDPVDVEGSVERLKQRVLPIFLRARERGVFLHVDLEEWDLHEITYRLYEEILRLPELSNWPHTGIVVQAYLRSARADAGRLLALVRERGAPLTVRLVKGAYWDQEIVRARQHGYDLPVWTDKAETDAQYEELSLFLLAHAGDLHPAFGSHNIRSLTHAIVQAEALGVAGNDYEIQMLYGMAEPERRVFRSMGRRVRVYAPVGDLLPGMAYLVRRLLENTSNTSFLRLAHRERADAGELLRSPRESPVRSSQFIVNKTNEKPGVFANCPLTDFTNHNSRESFARSLGEMRRLFPMRIPVAVSGHERAEGPSIERWRPGDLEMKIADITLAHPTDADDAVRAAQEAWPEWNARPLEERASMLERLSDILERDRHELSALEVYEAGKPWREADADVAEAVDYCRYYANQARTELAPRILGDAPGERNEFIYEGRGPTVVIAPWNFPLAILCGMSTAAVVAGNPVLLKPAEQSSATGYALYRRMREAGFPPGVVHFLPGLGEEVGDYLVQHPGIAQIAFTGSRDVGLAILEKAAKVRPGQRALKRVVCEMGGKNAIIVDEDADLDQAVAGIIQSAFGYAGQKCSACSRVIPVGRIADPLTARLIEATRSLILAPAHEPRCVMGSVVDEEAYLRLKRIIDNPPPGAVPLFVGSALAGGHFIPPALYRVDDPSHDLMQRELFGPILALHPVESFEQALDAAMDSEYALTGGVYSRSPDHLDLARQRFRVGNLYLNRPITGAMAGRQPFGGFHLSGAGTKAGGPGYLLNFAEPKAITENTTRRGFTPDVG